MKFVLATAFCDPAHLCALARCAEECGFDSVGVSDHLVHPETISARYPYTADGKPRFGPDAPWPDPWVAIGAMAAVTTRLRFLTNVFVLPLRDPFLVAKAVGTAAVLSHHRVALGIGIGWMKDEFDLLGRGFHDRGRRTDEMIEVLKKLWTGCPVEHHGRFHDFERLRMLPAPSQPIPIYVGGISEPALRRAARLGDGWISELHDTRELRQLARKLHALRDAAGRGGDPFHVIGAARDALDPDGYRRLAEAGVTHALTQPWALGASETDSLQARCDSLRRFRDDIIDKLD